LPLDRVALSQLRPGKWQKVLVNFHFLSQIFFYDPRLLEKPGHASLKNH